jgi:hypothetical protein
MPSGIRHVDHPAHYFYELELNLQIRRSIFFAASILLLALFAAACRAETATPEVPTATETSLPAATATATATGTATSTPTPAFTSTPTPTPSPFTGGPDDFPENVNPLTGLTVSDPTLLDRNPVMVKVANFPRGLRPHSGLSWADLVFEYSIGVGATRFNALYYGQNPPEVGPVRSARLIDAQLVNLYNSLLAFSSADPFVYDRALTALGSRAINEGPNTCPALCRTGTGDVNSVRAVPDLLTILAADDRDLPQVRPNLNGTTFDPVAPEGGASGLTLTVLYSSSTISEWRYDETIGLYTRYIEEVDANGTVSVVPLVDALTEEQLTAANVVVLFVETIEIKPTLHDFVLSENFAGRRGLLFRDGQVYEITWKSQGPKLPPQFFDADGELIPLQPGNTWFQIVGISSSSTEGETGVWTVTNFIP